MTVIDTSRHDYSQARRVRGPDALELLAAALVVSMIMAAGYGCLVSHVRLTEAAAAFPVQGAVEPEMVIHHALYGDWPSADEPALAHITSEWEGRYTKAATILPDHSLVVSLRQTKTTDPWDERASRSRLSFRPVLLGSGATVMFLCGHAPAPTGARAPTGADRTTTPENDLPGSCRSHAP